MKKLLPIFSLLLLFSACEQETKILEFSSNSVERRADNCNPEAEKCSFINLNFPLASGSGSREKEINEEIQNHLSYILGYEDEPNMESVENIANIFIQNYEKTKDDFPGYNTPWEATVYGEISYESDKLISIQFNSEVFEGGAHGYSSITWLNFNPDTGAIYSQDELFTEDFKNFIEHRFREEQGIPEGKSINSTGLFFENDEFHLPQNIGFNNTKVILYYNAYEIAAYADGPYRMEFSQTEISEYIKIEL
ncbi:PdaC/SigV domain-containing protein [Salegentibacter sp. F14]